MGIETLGQACAVCHGAGEFHIVPVRGPLLTKAEGIAPCPKGCARNRDVGTPVHYVRRLPGETFGVMLKRARRAKP